MGLLTSTRQYNRELYNKYSLCTKWISEIENRTPNNLYDILMRHRQMWAEGVQHSCFGPDKYGMFRTDSINNLDMNNLYLGNINGIWTHRASFFESSEFKFQDPDNRKCLTNDYIAICQQYKKHLVSNLRAMRSNIYDHGYNREKICSHIMYGYSAIHPNDNIENLKILNESIADNKVIDVSFSYNGRTINSTFVNIDGEFYLPEGFEKGVRLNPSKIDSYNLMSLYDVVNGNERYRQFSKRELKHEIVADKNYEMNRKAVKDNVRHLANYSKSKGVKFGM